MQRPWERCLWKVEGSLMLRAGICVCGGGGGGEGVGDCVEVRDDAETYWATSNIGSREVKA